MTWYYPLQVWFHIEYEDGDEEDIELDELNRAIGLAKKHARMTAAAAAAAAVAAVAAAAEVEAATVRVWCSCGLRSI